MKPPHLSSTVRPPALVALAAIALATLFALAGPRPASAQPAASPDSPSSPSAGENAEISAADQQIIDRILELQRQIQDLRSQLSTVLQDRLDDELFDLELAGLAADASGETQPPAATEPEAATEIGPVPTTPLEADTEEIPQPAAVPAAEADIETEAHPSNDGCNTLRLLDTSADGAISGSDRYWRYLRLWIDGNRDGTVQESEVQHPFDFGIVEIAGRLTVFRTNNKAVGDIRRSDRLYFEPLGKNNDTGILMVDATPLQRGDGLTLLADDLEVLEGLQAFRPGLSLRDAAGETVLLNCP